MSEGRRGGERRQPAPQSVRHGPAATPAASRHVLRSVLRPVRVNPHYTPRRKPRWWGDGPASRLGKFASAGGTNTGVGTTDAVRLATCHRSCKWARRDMRRKGRRSWSPSLRGSRARVRLLARRSSLQKSSGDVWSRISSANALQKERSGSSERGPSSERRSAGDTVGRRVARNVRRESSSPLRRESIGGRLRVTRDRHPAVHPSSRGGVWVAGPGL